MSQNFPKRQILACFVSPFLKLTLHKKLPHIVKQLSKGLRIFQLLATQYFNFFAHCATPKPKEEEATKLMRKDSVQNIIAEKQQLELL